MKQALPGQASFHALPPSFHEGDDAVPCRLARLRLGRSGHCMGPARPNILIIEYSLPTAHPFLGAAVIYFDAAQCMMKMFYRHDIRVARNFLPAEKGSPYFLLIISRYFKNFKVKRHAS